MKGDAAAIMPVHVTRALLAAFKAMPERRSGGWPLVDEES